MPTKLSRYADGLMEAAWLAAIILSPLFFNKYSSRIFEPDKATLLRSIALVILLAWCVKLINQFFSSKDEKRDLINIQSFLKIPLVIPVSFLTIVYIIATIFSVTPRISFWGSYQRLQGLYTFLAYVILFFSLVVNLRERSQVERLITTAILTSLPVSLYGVLQKYGIDPIPWGGNVTRRVASHMGNPIFVAAYLIMVFPLTVGRIVDSFQKILRGTDGLGYQTARSTIYIFIAALQLIAIYFTQSRGPLLGFLASSFFLFILLALHWRLRWLIILVTILGIFVGVFLITLNIPEGPLETIREASWMGRLGRMLDTEQKTSQVRILIWGGAAEMVAPHEPLQYPDGKKDPFNSLRFLIGFGPETMHMAYNPFYPPDLAYVESRNASPDRSHNETWDSLVITGGLGLIAYISVFTFVFYFGLKWLGLIITKTQKYLFVLLYFAGGITSSLVFYFWQGIAFIGVAFPFGVILGLIAYLSLGAFLFKQRNETNQFHPSRTLALIILLSAITAHFAEINFGIAIVSTRAYFFIFAGMLVAIGNQMPQVDEHSNKNGISSDKDKEKKTPRKSKKRTRRASDQNTGWEKAVIIAGMIGGLLLIPMNYEYISNLWGQTSGTKILWSSFTQVDQNVVSYGVLALILTTWISAGLILTTELEARFLKSKFWSSLLLVLSISAFMSIFYGFWLSGSLARIARLAPQDIEGIITQSARLEGLLTQFYAFLLICLLVLALFLSQRSFSRSRSGHFITNIAAAVGFIFVIWLSINTNLHIIQADIAFKMAEPFANSRQWAVANAVYRRAIELSPDEDYYYLFLGRASLEEAKLMEDPVQQEQAFNTARDDLLTAQSINPLNPDHTANLARLYSWWALQPDDPGERQKRGNISDDYYSRVTVLSPNNARLWDEWAILNLNVLKNPDRGLELLQHSLEIDPKYDWTHALLGDYYNQVAQQTEDMDTRDDLFQQAVAHYQKAIELAPKSVNYYFALASVYQSLNDIEMVISTLEDSLEFAPLAEKWKIEDNLVHYYSQLEEYDLALIHAQNALESAPASEKERIQTIITQLQSIP